jgi:hypothetical protein
LDLTAIKSAPRTLLPQADAAVRLGLAEADGRPLENLLIDRLKLA